MCFLGNHSVEKVNFLSMWSLPCRLFIFGAVVITMMKGRDCGSSAVAGTVGWQEGWRDRHGTAPPACHGWHGCALVVSACPARLREALASHRRKRQIPSQPGLRQDQILVPSLGWSQDHITAAGRRIVGGPGTFLGLGCQC